MLPWSSLAFVLRLSVVIFVGILALATSGYFFLFDDFALIGESANLPLHQLVIHPLFKFYRPAVFFITRASFAVFGWDMPWAHLALSQLVHLGNAALVYALVAGLRQSRQAAGVAAVLFLFSPWAAETFFWVSGRFDLFSTCGVLIAMVMALRVADAQDGRAMWRAGVAGTAGAALAVFSKETGIMTPVMCAGVLLAGRPWNVVSRRAPMVFVGATAAVCAVYLMARQWLLPRFDSAYGQLDTLAGNADLAANFLTYLRALITVPLPGVTAGSAVSWWVVGPAAIAGVAVWWAARRVAPKVAALAVAGFVLPLVLVLWLPLIAYSSAGGRYMYMAGIWVCVIAGIGLGRITRPIVAAALVALLLTGATVSVWHQSRMWAQAAQLSRQAIEAFRPLVDRGITTVMVPDLPFWFSDGPYVLKDYAFSHYFHGRQVPSVVTRTMTVTYGRDGAVFAGWINDAPEPEITAGMIVVPVSAGIDGVPLRFVIEPASVRLPAGTAHLLAPRTSQWAIDTRLAPHLEISPRSGTGPAMIRITRTGPPPAQDASVSLPITVDGIDGAATLEIVERAGDTDTTPPIGFVDAPAGAVSIADAPIVFQGWALDDKYLQSVWVGYHDATGQVVSLGPAVRRGERTDVTGAYPGYHDAANSAWSFVLQPTALASAPATLTLRVFAEDGSGHRTEIGTREVTRR